MRTIAFALAALTVAGCTTSSMIDPRPLGTPRVLAVGETYAPVPGGALRVSLLSVDSDSRCPASVQCVTSGEALVSIGVQLGTGPTTRTTLSTASPRNTAPVGSLRMTLDSLFPYPATPGPMPAQALYRAYVTFRESAPN